MKLPPAAKSNLFPGMPVLLTHADMWAMFKKITRHHFVECYAFQTFWHLVKGKKVLADTCICFETCTLTIHAAYSAIAWPHTRASTPPDRIPFHLARMEPLAIVACMIMHIFAGFQDSAKQYTR